MKILTFLLTLFISPIFLQAEPSSAQTTKAPCLVVDSLIGPQKICDPLAVKLVNAPVMQRLKGVDQSGIPFYFVEGFPKYTRFEHCIGVYLITKMAHENAKENPEHQAEEIAALLHDASHTAFSHTGDFVFAHRGNYHHNHSYQDHIHLWFLEQMGVKDLLKDSPLLTDQLDPDLPSYQALEASYPDMCADRIEYNLHTALIFKKITQKEIKEILNALKFKEGKWFFTNQKHAKRFASFSLYFTENFWCSATNEVLNVWGAELIKRALKLSLITENDLHFGQDEAVLKKIQASQDPEIQSLLKKLKNPAKHYSLGTKEHHTYSRFPKFRGIDPLIQTSENRLQRLSDLDSDFKKDYTRVQEKMKQGLYLIF